MIFEFLITTLIIELTPGPNMTWIALLGASRGKKTALAAVCGIALGLSIAGAAAGFGVSALIDTTPLLFQILRFAGSFYLLYLAWDSFRVTNITQKEKFDESFIRYFNQGLLSNMLNPKAYLVYAAILPQFVNPAQDLSSQLIILTSFYVIIATIIHIFIAILAGSFNDFFSNQKKIKIIGRIFAVLLALVAVWFFYATKIN